MPDIEDLKQKVELDTSGPAMDVDVPETAEENLIEEKEAPVEEPKEEAPAEKEDQPQEEKKPQEKPEKSKEADLDSVTRMLGGGL